MTDSKRSFEDLMDELEAVVAKMSSSEIGIEEAADLHEKASNLHAQAAARLEAVEARIATLATEEPA